MNMVRSSIWTRLRRHEGEVNGRWVVEVDADPHGEHPAGTLVCDLALPGTDDSDCFTAPNGKRYMDIPSGVRWTPKEPK